MKQNQIRILIAEDDFLISRDIERSLKRIGYDVLGVAPDGQKAVEMTNSLHPDIVLMDIQMPVMDGLEATKKIQKSNPTPVVVLTAHESTDLIDKASEVGVGAYLTKHPKPSEIERAIGIAMARHKDWMEIRRLNKQLQKEISHRRKTEESSKKTNEKLKKLNKKKSDFLSMVTHELRTRIAIIQEGVSICLDGLAGEITKTQREILTDTLTNITRLTRLAKDLLDLSKIEAGKIDLRRNPMNLSETIKKIIKSYDHQVQNKGIQLKTNLPKNSLRMYADADKITQIFNNLIDNAIRFTKSGGNITIKIDDKEKVIECSVSDTGIGIAKKNLSKLFSKFEQIGRAEGPGYKGAGLGLSIAKGLVEKHGGKIRVDSQLGRGTTVWFTLAKVPFPTILIVDDDKKFTEIIKGFLSKEDYLIKEAYDGKEVTQKARREKPDLIILDMMLPGMSGYEVVGRLKQDSRTHDIPIIIISGIHVDETKLNRVIDQSVIPIFSKPIDPDKLKMKVLNLLMN